MRIIAGTLGGRNFEAPNGHRTHPMSEKVRGALFNKLGSIDGLTVLDAFSGSGAISFEAISRGAKRCTAIEADRHACSNILKNVEKLQIETAKIKVTRANASGWSSNNPDQQFDIVVCDPPFDSLQLSLIDKLTRHVKNNGLYVLNWPGRLKIPELSGLQIVQNKSYGDTQLVFYRPIS